MCNNTMLKIWTSTSSVLKMNNCKSKLFRYRIPNQSVRLLSTYDFLWQTRDMITENDGKIYRSVLPNILHDVVEPITDVPEMNHHYVHVIEENSTRDVQAVGKLAVAAYKTFEPYLNQEKMEQISILGWCIDMLLSSMQITDDIVDNSVTRNYLPCWYKRKEIGLKAVNDAVLMENAPYLIMKHYFSRHSCYIPCLEWIHETAVKIMIGQILDSTSMVDGKPKFEAFIPSRYRKVALYKGTYSVLLLPVRMAMHLAGKYTPETYKPVNKFLTEVGYYTTSQNDILDCYINPSLTGKTSSDDIREGRGTWLITKALQEATPGQKQMLFDHYGQLDAKSEAIVRQVYEEIRVLDAFLLHEKESYERSLNNLQEIINLPRDFFVACMDTVYGCSDKRRKQLAN